MTDTDASCRSARPIRFVLYFPLGRTAPAQVTGLLRLVEDYLCRAFGGLTSYPAFGLYLLEGRTTIQRESVQVLEIYASPVTWARLEDKMHQFGSALARVLRQDNVAMSMEGELIFKRPDDHEEAEEWTWLSASLYPCSA